MISADIKTDIKQEIKKLVAVSYNFSSQNYLVKLVVPCSLILFISIGEDGESERVFT